METVPGMDLVVVTMMVKILSVVGKLEMDLDKAEAKEEVW